MLKFAIIGIGNAGNQVASAAAKEGFEVFCINSSEKDLDALDNNIPVYLFDSDDEGAGKDRRVAINLIKAHCKNIIQSSIFQDLVGDKDVIFIVSSTGGGTGSGCAVALTDILKRVYKNKLVIPIAILPVLGESIGAQRNTIEYLKELNRLEPSYMMFDNGKYDDLAVNEYMTKVNKEIVDTLVYIRGDYNYRSTYGMIDDADMLKILSVPGMINVTWAQGFKEKDMDEDTKLDSMILKNMKSNATCQLDKDRIVKRIGIILNLTENMVKYYDANIKILKGAIGEPFEVFEHYYVIEPDKEKEYENRIAIISSGLSIPDDRINIIIQRIQEADEALRKKKTSSLLDSIESLDAFKLDGSIDRSKSSNQEDIDLDFLDNY